MNIFRKVMQKVTAAMKGVEREVKVFNTGGWTIDSQRPFEQIGAAILFMNDALDVASLRLYNDGPGGGTVLLDVHDAEGRALHWRGQAMLRAIDPELRSQVSSASYAMKAAKSARRATAGSSGPK